MQIRVSHHQHSHIEAKTLIRFPRDSFCMLVVMLSRNSCLMAVPSSQVSLKEDLHVRFSAMLQFYLEAVKGSTM